MGGSWTRGAGTPWDGTVALFRALIVATAGLATISLVVAGGGQAASAGESGADEPAERALAQIAIPDAGDVRGNVTLPVAVATVPGAVVTWTSSNPAVVSDRASGPVAAGVVRRPPVGAAPATVTLTACVDLDGDRACRDFVLTVRPAVDLAPFSRYGMANFARSNSQAGQQIYMATSIGNDATRWTAANDGQVFLQSTKGMHAVRDPSVVRSPEGDRFYLVATDLNVDGRAYGWQNWDWAQSGASRYIEVWESTDLRTWSEQRHVLVAPPEAGMTFAPEAIWDPTIEAYVVYWTSSVYPTGSYYTPDRTDPNGRYPLTRNQTLYTTTRDFVTFTPPQTMINRPGKGTLDAVVIQDDEDGSYHRFVTDRTSTGVGTTKHVPSCGSEDIYQERATSVLAPPEQWELVKGCITHDTMATTYAEAPMVVKANPGDVRGAGYYLYADQKWLGSPSGTRLEEQLHPYWGDDLASGEWTPIDWAQKPNYDLALGVIRHGNIFALTQAEHAALRGADPTSIAVRTPPARTSYVLGEALDLTGLVVTADYTDGVRDEVLLAGHGGYLVSGYDPHKPGRQTVTVSYTVAGQTRTGSFQVDVVGVSATVESRCAGGKVKLTVAVRNEGPTSMDVAVQSGFGAKSFTNLRAGKGRSHPFTTHRREVPAAAVAVTASTMADGRRVQATQTVSYDAISCS
ncbi:immunoglobulin-like domain-containing protein [Micromonospora parva]|uniref:immunoglobulin-like domain-containing protein n=1 Tax=Micromonospora TaxID=1873 RepID=UPI002415CDB4|nr:immunoglobulin-like domain-containing protein [Micromonospora sp. WMMD967]MDG4840302.1 bacterial Ig-like domain-containing protein [Micromonospora sp. WMMD967]